MQVGGGRCEVEGRAKLRSDPGGIYGNGEVGGGPGEPRLPAEIVRGAVVGMAGPRRRGHQAATGRLGSPVRW